MLNIWSLGHLIQWLLFGRFVMKSWIIFLILSIGWELLEFILPYEFAIETTINKFTDLVVNTIGFYIGLKLRKDDKKPSTDQTV